MTLWKISNNFDLTARLFLGTLFWSTQHGARTYLGYSSINAEDDEENSRGDHDGGELHFKLSVKTDGEARKLETDFGISGVPISYIGLWTDDEGSIRDQIDGRLACYGSVTVMRGVYTNSVGEHIY